MRGHHNERSGKKKSAGFRRRKPPGQAGEYGRSEQFNGNVKHVASHREIRPGKPTVQTARLEREQFGSAAKSNQDI
jgi:hypothetical protein